MNTLMWEHPLTGRHLRQVAELFGLAGPPVATDDLADAVRLGCPALRLVPPVSKRLACGDVGVGALAPPEDVVAVVAGLLGRDRA